ncbi:competence protein ComK [Gracilibacillus halotolerans]|uniref:Competence protein ComK n=1 Tax=Gracilibacillus halotolerans TaxID=74386 RepID=A0A841RJG0_9BACI|nr:competence protein ComK [Gracilibacillus halotolerans]MBB6512639.1 competence protein ComK [Gracilibacillus halotolerans]
MEKTVVISPHTLAVVGEELNNGQFYTTIMSFHEEDDQEIDLSAKKVMDIACREFGISLRGLIEGSKMLSRITHKPPIAIDRVSGMYFFPTESPQNRSCSWIAHSHVLELEKTERGTNIIFKNGRELFVPASYHTIINQLYRTAQFRYLLTNKMEDIWNEHEYVSESTWLHPAYTRKRQIRRLNYHSIPTDDNQIKE